MPSKPISSLHLAFTTFIASCTLHSSLVVSANCFWMFGMSPAGGCAGPKTIIKLNYFYFFYLQCIFISIPIYKFYKLLDTFLKNLSQFPNHEFFVNILSFFDLLLLEVIFFISANILWCQMSFHKANKCLWQEYTSDGNGHCFIHGYINMTRGGSRIARRSARQPSGEGWGYKHTILLSKKLHVTEKIVGRRGRTGDAP